MRRLVETHIDVLPIRFIFVFVISLFFFLVANRKYNSDVLSLWGLSPLECPINGDALLFNVANLKALKAGYMHLKTYRKCSRTC